MNQHEVYELKVGQIYVIGRKVYAKCPDCGGFVRLNKPIIGDLHFCVPRKHEQKAGG